MHPFAWFIYSNLSRRSPRLLLLGVLFPALSFAATAQTQRIVRSFPVRDKPAITVVNAKSVTVTITDKNEVTLRAEVNGVGLTNEAIHVQQQENRLQIECPPPSEGETAMALLVPAHSR